MVNAANKKLKNLILQKEPCMIGRYGSVELRAMMQYEKGLCEYKKSNIALQKLCNNAGFFPETVEAAERFSEEMQLASESIDVLAIWYRDFEDYAIRSFMKSPTLIRLNGLEPFFAQDPWTSALKGRKVLVIHPFSKTIKSQYSRREKLFANQDILPQFELTVIPAVQTIGGNKDERFASWFEALEWMYQESLLKEFDVALIGCGAYGFPLAAKLKKAGKKAVHVGGALQLFFGIKGKRWDNSEVSKLYNEYWVRPLEEEQVGNKNDIEGGCYW